MKAIGDGHFEGLREQIGSPQGMRRKFLCEPNLMNLCSAIIVFLIMASVAVAAQNGNGAIFALGASISYLTTSRNL